ncbi:ankyrin-1 [Rosa sericea]
MTVFAVKAHVFPINYETEVSQRLVDAAHDNDPKSVYECLDDPLVDVNYVGTVCLKSRKTEIVLKGESAHEVGVEYEEFKTQVTALFLAAHSGNLTLVRKLLSYGANVNLKLFRGYATTAAVREGHAQILEVVINAGASQKACEEALLEASYLGRARLAEMLMASELIRPQAVVHALVSASCRGFVDVIDTLIKCGVNIDATDRTLLQSSKPSLYTNADCNALVAAIVSRQISVVRLLLQAGARTDIKVSLGGWSWDVSTGEEFRVGAGLAEAYSVTWCAVEYFEASGAILRMLLQHVSPNIAHFGRTLIHHAILCNNERAVDVLLSCDADVEVPIKTTTSETEYPIHMASRFGLSKILQQLIDGGCNANSRTDSTETPLMICARYKHQECFRILASNGADFGLVNSCGQSASVIAESAKWSLGFKRVVLDLIRAGKVVQSSNMTIFSPLLFVTQANDVEALKQLINSGCDINSQTESGETALMICARHKHQECFKVLASNGADFGLVNSGGQSASSIAESAKWTPVLKQAILDVIRDGKVVRSSNKSICSPLMLVTQENNVEALKQLIERTDIDVDEQDENGYSAAMIAAADGNLEAFKLLICAGADMNLQNKHGQTPLDLLDTNQNGEELEKLLLNHAVQKGPNSRSLEFYALHLAAQHGDLDLVHTLISQGYDVNAFDAEGYTPLMLAARGGHGKLCELLISFGARCDTVNARHETALSLARKTGSKNDAEKAILNEFALKLVLGGSHVKKHTKCGKGAPHSKLLRMVGAAGLLRWGKSSKRNVICKKAEVGPSDAFRWNRRRKFDCDEPGMFHVVTTKNKELHFVCEGGNEMAELWVRGIKLVTMKAIFGKNE